METGRFRGGDGQVRVEMVGLGIRGGDSRFRVEMVGLGIRGGDG